MTKRARLNVLCSSLASAGAALLAADSGWAAQPVRITAGAGLELHSNAARVSENEESDLARIARAGIAWADPVGPLSGDIEYSAERSDYTDDVQEDETAVNGRAALRWNAAPRLLDVLVQHEISQTQTDLRTANTANNRERRSVLTGGVDGYVHLSPVDSFVLRPRYSEVRFGESTQSDSTRANADLVWQHELSAVSKLNLQGGAGRVRFDDSRQDYDSQSAQLGYETTLARLSYSLSAGMMKFERDELDDVNGNSLHASLDYHATSFDVGGNLVRELTDSSIGLAQNSFTLPNFTANDSNFDQVDVLQRSQLDLFWRQRLSAVTALNFGIGGTRDDYEESLRDQDMYYAQIEYRYTVNSYWSLGLLGRHARTRFLDDPQDMEHKDTIYTASVQYHFSPRLETQLSLMRDDRKSNVSTSEYTDDIAMISVSYRFN